MKKISANKRRLAYFRAKDGTTEIVVICYVGRIKDNKFVGQKVCICNDFEAGLEWLDSGEFPLGIDLWPAYSSPQIVLTVEPDSVIDEFRDYLKTITSLDFTGNQ